MTEKYLNFNHEKNTIGFDLNEETGVITVDINGASMTFDSVQELAERYALARDVQPNNLKNWQLTENGEGYVFAPTAGTAGIDPEVVKAMKEAGYSPLEVAQALEALSAGTDSPSPVAPARAPRYRLSEDEAREALYTLTAVELDALGLHEESAYVDDLVTAVQEAYEDAYAEYLEEDGAEEPTAEEVVRNMVANAKFVLTSKYKGLPLEAAIDLERDTPNYALTWDTLYEQDRHNRAAQGFAGRSFYQADFVTIFTDEEDELVVEKERKRVRDIQRVFNANFAYQDGNNLVFVDKSSFLPF